MYTIEDEKKDEYNDEYVEDGFWYNNKGLIIKIIIIILCIVVLIWLFKALKSNRNTVNDENIHAANVLKVRLAAEEYFFIKNKKENNSTVSLQTLKKEGLVDDVVDANNKVCGDKTSNVNLTKDVDAYIMTVKLACSTNDKEEVFYYHKNTLACLNCNGQTKMTGEKNKEIDGGNKDDSNVVPVDNNEYREYSCLNWSDWTKDRVNDSNLKERSKTLVQGVKYNNTSKTVYGDWSEYTTTQIVPREDLEVEIKNTIESVWSGIKTSRNIKNSNNIRIVNTKIVEDNSNVCQDGFIENDICYSNKTTTGNLTFKEYNSGNYKIQNTYCEGLKTLKNSEGKYVLTYVGCRYNEKIEKKPSTYTVYEYQELETKDITYYRSRSVTTVDERTDPVYTEYKYEEKDLPEGYVKVDGSEETYYSYKPISCEK